MLDVQFEYNRFMTTQNVMDCSEERETAQDKDIDCGSITDMIWQRTNAQDVSAGPTGILYSPIYPRNDPFEVKGFILHKQVWHDLLKHAFESDISGIRIVLHTDTGREHSYDVRDGEVTYVGNRTHHCVAFSDGDFVECSPDDEWVPFDDLCYLDDEKSDDFRALKIPITEGIFSDETVNYYMDIYATEEFVSQFGHLMGDSEFPFSIVVCLGTVFVMLFTSLLFVAYDYYVRKEFNAKNQLLEAKRRFVRFVSHEVRTPLNTVCMGLTLLENDLAGALDGSELTKALKDSVNTSKMDSRVDNDELVLKKESVEDWLSLSTQVFHNADAAVGVLSDLLNYDKIQMGALTLELSLINLWATLEKTVEEFKMAATEKTVELSIDFSPLMKPGLFSADNSSAAKTDLLVQKGAIEESAKPQSMKASDLPADIQNCLVVGDKIRLTQVFRNLISNALKFSKPHTQMAVRISVDPLEEKKQNQEKISLHKNVLAECLNIGTVSVEVIDQGVGMTQEQVDTVFEDGTQFDANKLQGGGGSGLGLNIARGIVLEHGGTLTCSSEGIGKGTTFTLSTKLYKDLNASNQAEAEAHDDEENAGDANFTVPLLHVLVVDDSLTNRKLCQRLLERNGHRTEGASNGKEAVEMVEKSMKTGRYYDSILMDYEMPEMNGPDACRLIRKLGCSSYIAGVTGNVMSEDVDHFRSCGANWVIMKPFSINAMEDQWVEDGVTPFNETEESMVRVESSQGMIDLGGNLDSKMA
jgi:signal transduction histidine kinase/FixJ family two-component response regulator